MASALPSHYSLPPPFFLTDTVNSQFIDYKSKNKISTFCLKVKAPKKALPFKTEIINTIILGSLKG
ncbi:MAG: hypothetical protein ACFC03_00945 [Candidatus Malihini olakiniferum]